MIELHRDGAGILAGTDGAVAYPLVASGLSIHEELALLVEAGLSPLEALRTATLNPAPALGMAEDIGAVAPRKLADLDGRHNPKASRIQGAPLTMVRALRTHRDFELSA